MIQPTTFRTGPDHPAEGSRVVAQRALTSLLIRTPQTFHLCPNIPAGGSERTAGAPASQPRPLSPKTLPIKRCGRATARAAR